MSRWFLIGGIFPVVVVPTAYASWFFHPDRNHRGQRGQPAATVPKTEPAATVPKKETVQESWQKRHPMTRLPGITKVWDFKNDWSSNVTLAASLCTAVLANTGPLKGVLGEDAT